MAGCLHRLWIRLNSRFSLWGSRTKPYRPNSQPTRSRGTSRSSPGYRAEREWDRDRLLRLAQSPDWKELLRWCLLRRDSLVREMMSASPRIPRDEVAAEARAWEGVFQELFNLEEEAKGGIDA